MDVTAPVAAQAAANAHTRPAILGGSPAFATIHHLVRPELPPVAEVMADYRRLLETRMLSNQGEFVCQLERHICATLRVSYCALFCNATIATMILLKCLGLRGEVIVPSFTFAATVQALSWQGLTPRFVDLRRGTVTIDPDLVEAAITPRTSAIMPVNLFGTAGALDRLQAIATRHHLPLIYDSAQAFGTSYHGTPLGGFGTAEIFSLHATKMFHTGEGGAITTNNAALYRALVQARNFGFASYLNCTSAGINGKMGELPAIIGLRLLPHFAANLQRRRQLLQSYRDRLSAIPGVTMPPPDPAAADNCSYCFVAIDPAVFGLTNIELNYALMRDNIVTRCYFYPPVHRTAHFSNLLAGEIPCLPETDWAAEHLICLPLSSTMTDADIAVIAAALHACHSHAGEIRQVLRPHVPHQFGDMETQQFADPYDLHVAPASTAASGDYA